MLKVIRIVVVAATACLLVACGGPGRAAVAAPALDRQTAEAVAEKADEVRGSVLGGTRSEDLAAVYGGAALEQLSGRAATLAGRGFRLEERFAARAFVGWDPRVPDVVLQVEAQDRLVSPDDPEPAWSATVRQVWSRFGFAGGGWRVVESRDLSPDQWRAP